LARVERLENISSISVDERLSFFSVAMPPSSGKHSNASKAIDNNYGKRCLFCGDTTNISKAHIVAGNHLVNYSCFGKPTYKDDLDCKSPRNFLPLCGTLGAFGTCHDRFDKYLVTLLYNAINNTYYIYCFDPSWSRYSDLHRKVVTVPSNIQPYRRLLAWRTRKCLLKHGSMVKTDIDVILRLCNFSEESKSMTKETRDEDSDTKSANALL
jgi:hypothetical protein